ncbi:MAG: SLBB domain-containing protein [Candidatus Marinimicrobia bacterium]|nr:SLBB domain-containing protein [Candidatus Neomarinimicrobiota bacterium]
MRYVLNILLMISFVFAQDAADIKKKIKESGFSESQIRQMARQRGMSEADIDAKAAELKGETTGGAAPQPTIETIPEPGLDDVSLELGVEDAPGISEEAVIEQESQIQPGKKALPYFGYDIFKRDPALFQASVFGAVDPDYNIGPGDEIIIMLWGETQFRQVLKVDREGFIFIPEVGQVFVNGLTMDLLESKLFKVLSRRYSSLVRSNGESATTFLDVSLGNLRPLRILVVGEVAQPGAFRVSPSTTLFSSLYYFNGPTPFGSLRDVRLIRGGKQIASIDFYHYLLSGKNVNDVRLQLDDTIYLPPRGKTVSIQGEINRPAIYELKEDEGLLDLITTAGELKISAYLDRIQIDRIVPVEEREIRGMDRMYVDINLKQLMESENDFELLDGDVIQVFPVMDLRKNYVEIRGNVERPGTYEIEDGMHIVDLIDLADGVINDAFLTLAHLIRINEDLTQDLIEINLGAVLKGDEKANIALQPFDALLVYNQNTVFNAFKTVEIRGSVKRPGRYPYFENMGFRDLIVQAGGFSNDVYRAKMEIMRVDPNDPDKITYGKILETSHFITRENIGEKFFEDVTGGLQPHDVVFIRPDPNFILNQRVKIIGAVYYPGDYTILSPEETISSIVKRAGGIQPNAFPDASLLIREGQEINLSIAKAIEKPGSKYDFKVLTGDVITINVHPNVVAVYGEVNNPGLFKYLPGLSSRHYIKLAGGFTIKANRSDVWIRYASGDAKKIRRFKVFSPRVLDGSVITIARDDSEEIDKTELAKEITSILANLAQVIMTVLVLSKI